MTDDDIDITDAFECVVVNPDDDTKLDLIILEVEPDGHNEDATLEDVFNGSRKLGYGN